MAWQWSHSDEAYATVEKQLHDKAEKADKGNTDEAEWLCVVWAEWMASNWKEHLEDVDLDSERYVSELDKAKKLAEEFGYDELATAIWQRSSNWATCTNGGWAAHMCPFGCHCHMLPFTAPDLSDAQ